MVAIVVVEEGRSSVPDRTIDNGCAIAARQAFTIAFGSLAPLLRTIQPLAEGRAGRRAEHRDATEGRLVVYGPSLFGGDLLPGLGSGLWQLLDNPGSPAGSNVGPEEAVVCARQPVAGRRKVRRGR